VVIIGVIDCTVIDVYATFPEKMSLGIGQEGDKYPRTNKNKQD
jgi:hypothetical protein